MLHCWIGYFSSSFLIYWVLRFYFWLLVVLNFDLELRFARAAPEFDVMFKLACSWENL